MTARLRYALVVLALLPLALSALTLWGATVYYHREQASQRAQSESFERRLCTTLGRLAALKPPPGSAADNPSRAYLQQEHAVLAELGPDVGCKLWASSRSTRPSSRRRSATRS